MRYIIIGGINGVGKSTICSTLSDEDAAVLGRRINADDLVSSYGDWRDSRAQFLAGKQAVKDIKMCLKEKMSFHQETTLSGYSILNTAKIARDLGYTKKDYAEAKDILLQIHPYGTSGELINEADYQTAMHLLESNSRRQARAVFTLYVTTRTHGRKC